MISRFSLPTISVSLSFTLINLYQIGKVLGRASIVTFDWLSELQCRSLWYRFFKNYLYRISQEEWNGMISRFSLPTISVSLSFILINLYQIGLVLFSASIAIFDCLSELQCRSLKYHFLRKYSRQNLYQEVWNGMIYRFSLPNISVSLSFVLINLYQIGKVLCRASLSTFDWLSELQCRSLGYRFLRNYSLQNLSQEEWNGMISRFSLPTMSVLLSFVLDNLYQIELVLVSASLVHIWLISEL